jgi:hypothetical protein
LSVAFRRSIGIRRKSSPSNLKKIKRTKRQGMFPPMILATTDGLCSCVREKNRRQFLAAYQPVACSMGEQTVTQN